MRSNNHSRIRISRSKNVSKWYKEFLETGKLHGYYRRESKFTEHQKNYALNYFLEHGRSVIRTIRAIGYPSKDTMKLWLIELTPDEYSLRIRTSSVIQSTQEQKIKAVIELCTREESAAKVGTSRTSLCNWKHQLLGERSIKHMNKPKNPIGSDDKESLLSEIESLKKQIYRQQMEIDVLNKAAEIIKKIRASI